MNNDEKPPLKLNTSGKKLPFFSAVAHTAHCGTDLSSVSVGTRAA